MLTSTLLTGAILSACRLAVGQTTGELGDAPVVSSNPVASYSAEIASGSVRGWANASAEARQPVLFSIQVEGLPEDAGPYKYHIHQYPVPTDGNCTGTGGHLDPYGRTQSPACDTPRPETCEVGDLSGKHGSINQTAVSLSFADAYTSLDPGNVAFLGNLSFVIHDAAAGRIACANWTAVQVPEGEQGGSEDGGDEEGGSCPP